MANSRSPQSPFYVRVLYNYEASAPGELSLREGDILMVVTQMESGWWDGVIENERGWFPSNYCTVISGPAENRNDGQTSQRTSDENSNGPVNGAINGLPNGAVNGLPNGAVSRGAVNGLPNGTSYGAHNQMRNGNSRL